MAANSGEVISVQGQANGQVEPVRHTENHLPCIWGDFFSVFSVENSVLETKTREIEGFKLQVREMLVNGASDKVYDKIGFIYTLDRLGLSYHFVEEINNQLEEMFTTLDLQDDEKEYDLYTTTLMFRVFRHHGLKMSCDVFNKFKDSNTGAFKESLATDIKGMLSLYEASHIRIRGEDVLEEALDFTKTHLMNVEVSQISPHLQKQVTRALHQAFYKGFPRLETRFYLSVYEEDESRDELMLKFAKSDYNLVQLLYQQELSLISKWWKKKEFMKTYPYDKHVRSRMVESYFFALSLVFEPYYSVSRMMVAKLLILFIVTDDIYDGYGTIEELQLFTDAIDKWDMSCVDQLPDYMKPLYRTILELFIDFNDQVINDGRSYSVYYTQEHFKELLRVNFHEAKMFKKGYIPPLDEYMEAAKVSSGCGPLVSATFIGMEVTSKEAYEWLKEQPKILAGIQAHSRILDDIQGSEFEPKPSSVSCYMKEYGVSRNEAVDKLWEMANDEWNDIIETWLNRAFPLPLLETMVNLARFMDATYKEDDGYDHPKVYVELINAVLVHPVPM